MPPPCSIRASRRGSQSGWRQRSRAQATPGCPPDRSRRRAGGSRTSAILQQAPFGVFVGGRFALSGGGQARLDPLPDVQLVQDIVPRRLLGQVVDHRFGRCFRGRHPSVLRFTPGISQTGEHGDSDLFGQVEMRRTPRR